MPSCGLSRMTMQLYDQSKATQSKEMGLRLQQLNVCSGSHMGVHLVL